MNGFLHSACNQIAFDIDNWCFFSDRINSPKWDISILCIFMRLTDNTKFIFICGINFDSWPLKKTLPHPVSWFLWWNGGKSLVAHSLLLLPFENESWVDRMEYLHLKYIQHTYIMPYSTASQFIFFGVLEIFRFESNLFVFASRNVNVYLSMLRITYILYVLESQIMNSTKQILYAILLFFLRAITFIFVSLSFHRSEYQWLILRTG